jgi:hypothetical protein
MSVRKGLNRVVLLRRWWQDSRIETDLRNERDLDKVRHPLHLHAFQNV